MGQEQTGLTEHSRVRIRPLGLLITSAIVLVGVALSIGTFYLPQGQPVRIFLIAWTIIVAYGLLSQFLFVLTVAPTGLRWRYFRWHELNFEDIRDVRIIGDRPGGKLLVIRSQRGAGIFRMQTVNLRHREIQSIIAAVERRAPQAILDERTRGYLRPMIS